MAFSLCWQWTLHSCQLKDFWVDNNSYINILAQLGYQGMHLLWMGIIFGVAYFREYNMTE